MSGETCCDPFAPDPAAFGLVELPPADDPAFLEAVGLGVAASIPELVHETPTSALYWGDNLPTLAQIPPSRISNGVRLILTDPPFARETHAGATTQRRGRTKGLVDFASATADQLRAVFEACRPLMDYERGGWAVFTCDWRHCAELLERPPRGWKGVRFGIWNKLGTGAPQFTGDRPATGWEAVCHLHTCNESGDTGGLAWNGRGRDAVYAHRTVGTAAYPTEKPRSLGAQLIELFTDPGELILDPWCGGAGWGRAALDHQRRWIGIDRAEAAIVLARKRLAQETLFVPPPLQKEIAP